MPQYSLCMQWLHIFLGWLHMVQVFLVLIFLSIANGISLLFFGVDKFKSKKGGYRIAESKLLLSAFVGPFGAYAGMLLFRHKTRKIKFLVVPLFLLIQVILILYFTSFGCL